MRLNVKLMGAKCELERIVDLLYQTESAAFLSPCRSHFNLAHSFCFRYHSASLALLMQV